MKKLIFILITLAAFSQTAFAKGKIQFYCDSQSRPTFEFPIDINGSVHPVHTGHFSQKLSVDESPLRNGDVRVTINPFHAYCSIAINYMNHTNNYYNTGKAISFSGQATLAISCEGEAVTYKQCLVSY